MSDAQRARLAHATPMEVKKSDFILTMQARAKREIELKNTYAPSSSVNESKEKKRTTSDSSSLIDRKKSTSANMASLKKDRHMYGLVGLTDRAVQVDKAISKVRAIAEREADVMDARVVERKVAKVQWEHKKRLNVFEAENDQFLNALEAKCGEEKKSMLKQQEDEIMQVFGSTRVKLDGPSRKGCTCPKPYLCRHNKEASFGMRRPSKELIETRDTARKLKDAGKGPEAREWQLKADKMDREEEKEYQKSISKTVFASPWGANDAALDALIVKHHKELQDLGVMQSNRKQKAYKDAAATRQVMAKACEVDEMRERLKTRKENFVRRLPDGGVKQQLLAQVAGDRDFIPPGMKMPLSAYTNPSATLGATSPHASPPRQRPASVPVSQSGASQNSAAPLQDQDQARAQDQDQDQNMDMAEMEYLEEQQRFEDGAVDDGLDGAFEAVGAEVTDLLNETVSADREQQEREMDMEIQAVPPSSSSNTSRGGGRGRIAGQRSKDKDGDRGKGAGATFLFAAPHSKKAPLSSKEGGSATEEPSWGASASAVSGSMASKGNSKSYSPRHDQTRDEDRGRDRTSGGGGGRPVPPSMLTMFVPGVKSPVVPILSMPSWSSPRTPRGGSRRGGSDSRQQPMLLSPDYHGNYVSRAFDNSGGNGNLFGNVTDIDIDMVGTYDQGQGLSEIRLDLDDSYPQTNDSLGRATGGMGHAQTGFSLEEDELWYANEEEDELFRRREEELRQRIQQLEDQRQDLLFKAAAEEQASELALEQRAVIEEQRLVLASITEQKRRLEVSTQEQERMSQTLKETIAEAAAAAARAAIMAESEASAAAAMRERAEADAKDAAKRARERAEDEAAAHHRRLETIRLEALRIENQRLQAAKDEATRIENRRLEQERHELERAESRRLEALRADEERRIEEERIRVKRLDAERHEAARAHALELEQQRRVESARLDTQILEAKKLEADRLAILEAERAEKLRKEQERVEREALEAQRLEAIRLEAYRKEVALLEKQRLEAERLGLERVKRENAAVILQGRARMLSAKSTTLQRRATLRAAEIARAEAELLEAERLAAERLEAERLEFERLETERLEAERLEAEYEAELLEAERLEAELLEGQRLTAERLEAECATNATEKVVSTEAVEGTIAELVRSVVAAATSASCGGS